ncbi:AMP-binding protein [Streptomyces sp. O3]
MAPRGSQTRGSRVAARGARLPDGGVPLADLLAAVRPPAGRARAFTESGVWRSRTVLHDLYRGAVAHPHRVALVAHRAHKPEAARVIRVSYAQLGSYTDRFAYALDALGVRQGDPVAFQLANRWETCVLLLACLRVGAVAVPVMPGYGARDLEAVLTAAQPRVCVVPDLWEGTAPARILTDLAPSLPWLRHRVVLGDAADTGAIDFLRHFVRTPHERYHRAGRLPLPVDLPDRITHAVTTLGLHGSHTMAMHTANTLYAGAVRDAGGARGVRGVGDAGGAGGAEGGAFFSALPLAAAASTLHAVVGPLVRGGTIVLQDVWDPDAALDLMATAGVRETLASAAQWAELVVAQEQRPRALRSLRQAHASDAAGAATGLVRQVHKTLRVPLDAPAKASPPPDDGPAAPLAIWRRDRGGLRLTWGRDDGHANGVGDSAPAYPDDVFALADGEGGGGGGEGGDRDVPVSPYAEEAEGEEVGGLFLVPVTEVEERLLTHPRVAEAAVVACTDPEHGELACAVVVPDGAPPSLLDLRGHLTAHGTQPAHLPARLELLGALPRTAAGGVHRAELRRTVSRRLSLPA